MTRPVWIEEFKPMINTNNPDPKGIDLLDAFLFEPHGKDLQQVHQMVNTEDGRVWSLLKIDPTDQKESEEGNPVIVCGYRGGPDGLHPLGYFLTEEGLEAANVLIEVFE